MICPSCREAGKALRERSPRVARELHATCQDPLKCTCNHEVAPIEQIVASAARRPV
jgi:hypothetical protein